MQMECSGSNPDSRAGADNWRSGYQAPAVNLPKGGGAIKGIGEKFSANPVTGTGSLSVPIFTSPGRSGFGPQLSLSYDSGAGNGPFGFGWTLALPSITCKTDKGLPQYMDAQESDVFVLSGAEDLVPVLQADGQRHADTASVPGFLVQRYRPRIEGLFARIERWTDTATGDIHWRSISKDNILSVYGRSGDSRIADPLDPTRIFTWLICETRDDKGNAVVYDFKSENGEGVDLAAPHERNRERTANRYLKRVCYGNHTPLLVGGQRPRELPDIPAGDWMFEVVFDYGDHAVNAPTPRDTTPWPHRGDAFSSYRSGFEVRTSRLCQRVLMFHHFDGEPGVGRDCLVRSTDFDYSNEVNPTDARNPIYTFLQAVTQTGYRRDGAGGYISRSLPPVEFEYTPAQVQSRVEDVPSEALQNLPIGVDEAAYQWIDLHGEGIPGILTEQAGAWFYKRNLSPLDEGQTVNFGPLEQVAVKPNTALAAGAQFMDLAGDGLPDLVTLDGPMPGLYEHDEAEGWQSFRPLISRVNRPMRDPNLRMLDLDGDGHADLLITENDAFVIHLSLGEAGFGATHRIAQALDEEKGPRLVFAETQQTIFLADMSGDGLTDLVRIRNGEVCYWPNLGHGHFGAKVTMDAAPWFDHPDQFDPKRLRLADIDGSGTTDLIYLHRDGVRLYFNQCGNGWSAQQALPVFPRIDDLVHVSTADLLGNGTACLVWSSPLPGDARRQMRYVNLMGDAKPHLLVRTINNLGAETRVQYAPSTKFYLQDKRAGKPWITRLPFPVHVVERVETFDHISRNHFVTRYAYHHGYFDGEEREFRGFGMVEQWDTEQFAALAPSGGEGPTNIDAASHVPPVLTRTWFHTGLYLGRDHVSDFFAGLLDDTDQGEYFREPGLSDVQARALLLPDTVLPEGLTLAEEREACRALKGSMLRQEVYALDRSAKEPIPYSVAEQNFSIRCLQPAGKQRHAVFFTHAREALTYHYERNPADPRVQHALTLEVDDVGNVLKQAAVGYGRRPGLSPLNGADRDKQQQRLVTYTENRVTNAIDTTGTWRQPLPCEVVTFELTGYATSGPANRYVAADFVEPDPAAPGGLRLRFTDEVAYEAPTTGNRCRRPIEWLRTLFRRDDLTGLLPLGEVAPLALPGEAYKLAFTPGLLTNVYQRDGVPLLPAPAQVLAVDIANGLTASRGGYVELDGDGRWWLPSGRSHFSSDPAHSPQAELVEARRHFFLPRRYRDPFGQDSVIDFDTHDLLMVETRDALGNRVTVESNDYRVLQPRLVSDPNRNRTEVAFDTLGMVAGTAVMGKAAPAVVEGDSLVGFEPDLTQAQLDTLMAAPRQPSADDPQASEATPIVHELLQGATTRIVYDLDRHQRLGEPPFAATIARETHVSDLPKDAQGQPTRKSKLQLSFSYSDGFGREIQKKIQAEPGRLDPNDPQPVHVNPRWVGSGWTIFNNKGKPVRQYEPFFSATHGFEFNAIHGVSPVLFYDPADRVVAKLHPNHTYEKVVFDPWQQTTWDVNDTCAARPAPLGDPRPQQTGDPRTDPDIAGYVRDYFAALPVDAARPWLTWHAQRIGGALGTDEQNAARRAAAHADTPTTAHFDALGRPFLTVARNRVVCADHDLDGREDDFATRVELDIEGNQRSVRDAITHTEARDAAGNTVNVDDPLGRVVMRYAYDMLGNRIRQISMEAGTRWMLNDVAGKPIRAWDSRGHHFTTRYDALRRPTEQMVRGSITNGDAASDPRTLNRDILVDRIDYGEPPAGASQAELDRALQLNLRTRIYRHFDSAGVATNAGLDAAGNPTQAYDFKGNLLRSTRQLVSDYTAIPDWLLAPKLDNEFFEGSTRYDALNRPIQSVAPRSSLGRGKFNVIQPVFNEANLLDRVDVWLDRAAAPGALLDPAADAASAVGVANIDYDAKGQRERIDYKNGASTFYRYDPLTFRLIHLLTRRKAADFPGDDPQPPLDPAWPGKQVQNLHYTYDPAGNITHIQDDAQQTIYFRNQRVEPSNDYVYDALYRLIQATGREHLGQGGVPIPHSHNDAGRTGILSANPAGQFAPNDASAMGTYTERYVYDAVGNFLQMQHARTNGPVSGWARTYSYQEPSLTEPAKFSNRLSSTTVGHTPTEVYAHDAHGNMLRMPHLGGGRPSPNMHWDHKDQLRQTDLGGGGTAYYVYDASGQRVRKVWEKAPGLTEERIYLGGFEIFRKHGGSIGVNTATLERETLHVMDDKQRIAMVETRSLDTAGDDQAPPQLIRYQFGNHLGSASLELNDQAQIISYEEYVPYGSSTCQAVRSQAEVAKRYRYTGKERDEESGLYYHVARYCAAWLGRWTRCDPILLSGGLNQYRYAISNPIVLVDSLGTTPGNPGVFQDYVSVNGRSYARYKAIEGTWISASLLEQGYSEASSAPAAYELAGAHARTASGKPFANPDRLAAGQEFLIETTNVAVLDFTDEPEVIEGRRLPETTSATDPFRLSTGSRIKHWFVDPNAWVNADSDSTDNYPSFELQGSAPPAHIKSPEDRVAYWLSIHKKEIVRAEERWNVPREAIAGIIAWEALKNPQAWSISSAGPGKMHLEEKGGWPQEIEKSGRASVTPDFMRKYYMKDPLTAIMYIAAGLDLVATISEKSGWDLRHNPELLGHIYHAFKPGQWSAKISSKPKSEKFQLPPGGMGDWIGNNLPYLRTAVGSSPYGP